jgi:hypothetical protein
VVVPVCLTELLDKVLEEVVLLDEVAVPGTH